MQKIISPKHVAFIVDGNRRWAKKQNLPTISGHKKATDEVIDKIVFACLQKNIPYVTFWAFSTENWKRGEKFTKMLFDLLRKTVKKDIEKYQKAGIRLNTIGDLSKIPSDLVAAINARKQQSQNMNNLTVTIALNYGGRDEILRAIKKIIANNLITSENLGNLTEEFFSKQLDTADLPDIDLLIRTGGEKRFSGFMPWQSIYTELAFSDTLFPDFTIQEFEEILQDFSLRDRRFGGDSQK